jgi:hypothetical protein
MLCAYMQNSRTAMHWHIGGWEGRPKPEIKTAARKDVSKRRGSVYSKHCIRKAHGLGAWWCPARAAEPDRGKTQRRSLARERTLPTGPGCAEQGIAARCSNFLAKRRSVCRVASSKCPMAGGRDPPAVRLRSHVVISDSALGASI